jgi:flavorubredoxin
MKAVVVYQSLWGNTAAIARAIAEGLGPETTLLSTAEATPAALENVDLIVAGAPVLGFRAPNDAMIKSVADNPTYHPRPDTSQPSMRTWLSTVPKGHGYCAAFETRIWWSPGGSISTIETVLKDAGYSPLIKGARFVVKGQYGPLRDGELERARQWGADLTTAMAAT